MASMLLLPDPLLNQEITSHQVARTNTLQFCNFYAVPFQQTLHPLRTKLRPLLYNLLTFSMVSQEKNADLKSEVAWHEEQRQRERERERSATADLEGAPPAAPQRAASPPRRSRPASPGALPV